MVFQYPKDAKNISNVFFATVPSEHEKLSISHNFEWTPEFLLGSMSSASQR
jgi:hypothetical protein